LQHVLFAEKTQFTGHLPGMDASGKDGATRKVFSIVLLPALMFTHFQTD
jgi:hypothetical protein